MNVLLTPHPAASLNLAVGHVHVLDAREFKALCCLSWVPRHVMKQGVVHFQAARDEAVRRAVQADINLQGRQAQVDSLVRDHNAALQALNASKVSHTFARM